MLLVCVDLWLAEWVHQQRAYAMEVTKLPAVVWWGLYIAGMLAFLLFGNFGTCDFIYLPF